MLLPDKHISFAESLIGLGSFILENLTIPQDIDALWRAFEKIRGTHYPAYHSFDNMVLAVDMLYAINAIEMDQNGKLIRQTFVLPDLHQQTDHLHIAK